MPMTPFCRTATKKGTQDEEIIPVRVLGFDEWKGIEPDPSDPELIQHFFSEWTKARIKRFRSTTCAEEL